MGIPHVPIEEFYLLRDVDETGTSGEGVVARGVIMPSGVVHLEWLSHVHTETRFNNIRDVELLHGHGGRTKVVMGQPPQPETDETMVEPEIEKKKKGRKKKSDPTSNKSDGGI